MMTTGRREGTLRLMTLGEIAMARQFYGDAIVYSRVWIHCDSYFPFWAAASGLCYGAEWGDLVQKRAL